ncbi:Flp pilus assembly protein CpaB [Propylenella binzhouense]|uniref:Flp pilus assembly protein CpaB n=1 Tax=Propylenella binzhouense TaxID=2555902 RepID=A0A964T6E4_9HYPH|nr:Flp pilus assembly protein CpaB [Propylenella binzhouense]MYZ48674.1 Flp pilus assembly protein CpaB [Propylenella binzhouense]
MFRVIVLAIALVAGGIAAYLALSLGSGDSSQTVVELAPQISTQEVVVASKDLNQGQALSEENLRWQKWPEEAVNAAFITKADRPDAIETLKGAVVRSQFAAGEPIREAKLAQAGSGFMSAILPSGKRAVAVRVSAQNTAGGFILPNDRVDVIQTVSQTGADGQNETVSRTILTNIRVLAIDQTVDDSSGEPVVVGKTATLEVDPVQAEVVTSAEASGTLSLALRAMADTDEKSVANERQSGTVKIYRSGRSQIVKTQ